MSELAGAVVASAVVTGIVLLIVAVAALLGLYDD